MCRLIAPGYQQMWQVLFPQGQSSNAVHVISLKKKGIRFGSTLIECFCLTSKILKANSVIFRVMNAYITTRLRISRAWVGLLFSSAFKVK